jgi:hypothetical protein
MRGSPDANKVESVLKQRENIEANKIFPITGIFKDKESKKACHF